MLIALLITSSLLQVLKVKVRQCNAMSVCTQCLGQRDPYCGWCVVENRCMDEETCRRVNLLCLISYFAMEKYDSRIRATNSCGLALECKLYFFFGIFRATFAIT